MWEAIKTEYVVVREGESLERVQRRTIYHHFAMKEGHWGNREKLPSCVERQVRELFPSEAYMGFQGTNKRKVSTEAVTRKGDVKEEWFWVWKDGQWSLTKSTRSQ